MIPGLYIRLIAIGLIVAALAGGVWYVRDLQGDVEALTIENAKLLEKIKEQNAAVDAMKKEADLKLAAAQAAIDQAKVETAAAKARASNAYKARPADPNNLCQSALDLMNGGAK